MKAMIWPSLMESITVTTGVATGLVVVTLAPHTNHQLGINITLNKPSRCLLVTDPSRQQKLKYFTELLHVLQKTLTLNS